jgi:CheY-like chemotaxis protein
MNDSNSAETIQVVLVEDSSDDARMTLRAMAKLSPAPSVKWAVDGEQAVSWFKEWKGALPELVVLDLKMPKLHGLEVLRILKLGPSTSSIPVVVLTSSDEPSDIKKAIELGAAEYVCKPMDPLVYGELVCQTTAKYLRSRVCGM